MNIKAKILPDEKSQNKEAVWLYVSRTPEKSEMINDIESILGIQRDEDQQEDMLIPIKDSEVQAIKEACEEWLNNK